MTRILLAVNDSPAGVTAARAAIRLARESHGQVRAIHVVDPSPPRGPQGRAQPGDPETSERASLALLAYVSGLAERAGVPIETLRLPGLPAQVILEQAAAWEPDVIVLGRSGVRHVGQPFVGSQVLHVIEFADVPVLVVPAVP